MALQLSANMEDYLETIYRLAADGAEVRVKDIAGALSVTLPSVTSALRKLRESGAVEHERYGRVTLTGPGNAEAQGLMDRHQALTRFLSEVLLLEATGAEDEACRMEHAVGPETLERLAGFVRCVLECPQHDRRWLGSLQTLWSEGATRSCGDTGVDSCWLEGPRKTGNRG